MHAIEQLDIFSVFRWYGFYALSMYLAGYIYIYVQVEYLDI